MNCKEVEETTVFTLEFVQLWNRPARSPLTTQARRRRQARRRLHPAHPVGKRRGF